VTWPEASDVLIPAAPSRRPALHGLEPLNGGVDNRSEARLVDQLALIRACAPDVLCLPEATCRHGNGRCLLEPAMEITGLRMARLARSRSGRGVNATALLYKPKAVGLVGGPNEQSPTPAKGASPLVRAAQSE
jgi:hypothetical protein